MKRNTLLILTLLMGVVFYALPASACDFTAVSVDCYNLTVEGDVGYIPWRTKVFIGYKLTATSNTSGNIEIEGIYEVIVPSEYVSDPDNYNTLYPYNVSIPLEWPNELCGEYSIEGTVVSSNYQNLVIAYQSDGTTNSELYIYIVGPTTVVCDCPPPPLQCVRSPGYWKTHPDEWPVEEIEIGGVVHSKDQAIALMKTKGKKNKVFTMFRALVAAKLNLIVGSDPTCIEDTVAAADDWMRNTVGTSVWWSGKKWGKGAPWRVGEPLYETLDDYNNGLLCAPSCDTVEEEENGDACGCRGKVTTLTLQYNGAETAFITVMQKKSDNPVFSGSVLPGPGGQFTFVGTDKDGTLGTEISIYVGEDLNTTIHTSCSRPIGPGLISGDFEVIEGESREGGTLCVLTSPFTSQCKKCRKKPKKGLLTGNFPNPFNPVTTISFSLPQSSHVTLEIYNSLGAKVATLAEDEFSSGNHSVVWKANDYATGMYFCRITAGSITEVKKLLFMK